MKHTPGPWKIIDHGEDTISITDAVQDEGVCVVGSAYERTTIKANAKLIAAAPELLDALVNCLDMLEAGDREQVVALIAKATGGA